MGLDSFKTGSSSSTDIPSGHVDLDRSEVLRRIPHIDKIDNDLIRHGTVKLTQTSPEYFWNVPASSSGYHNEICRDEHGLWAHTLMVATAVERLSKSYVNQGLISKYDADCARSAAILHDQRKNGNPKDPHYKSTSDHDVRMARVIKNKSDLPSQVSSSVMSHMGPWYDGPNPSSELDKLVHNADMVASTNSITADIYGDVPDELYNIGVRSYNS